MLNSRVVYFWLKHKGKIQGKLFQIDKEPLLTIPLLVPAEKEQQSVIVLVERILEAKLSSPLADTGKFEREIDRLMYQVYDLTPDEIAVVEGRSK